MDLPRLRHAWAIAALVLLLVGPVSSAPQSGRRPGAGPAASGVPNPDGEQDEIRLETREVLLSVTVRDADGHPVTRLTADDFIVAEDRVRQRLVSCTRSRLPVNVVLLLDASGSVFSELASIRRAAASFVERLGPEDQVSVIQFADTVDLLQDWTTDRDSIRHALNWRFRGGEATAFWDAVYLAAADQLSKVQGRRAVIILSDGVDTSSKVSERQALAALDRADTSVYIVSKAEALIAKARPYAGLVGTVAGTAPTARYAIERLREAQERMGMLADRYGGRMYTPMKDDDLASAYGQVAEELGQQYVLSYVSSNDRRDGSWRTIELFLAQPGLTARTRKGYVAD
jgi:VWFA-related protein